MAHYAKIENDVVVEVITAEEGDFITTLEGEWVQTSYNTFHNTHKQNGTPLRGNYAGIGFSYDRDNDVFIPPKPFDSWLLDESIWDWVAPVSEPEDSSPTNMYEWSESTLSWVPLKL